MSILIQESVLLFYSKPGVLILGLVHHLIAQLAMVGVCWFLVVLVSIAHNKNVVSSPEWVGVQLDWVEVGVRVGTFRLVCGASIIVPDGKFRYIFWLFLKSFSFRPQTLSCTIDPDVKSLHPDIERLYLDCSSTLKN